MKSPDKTVHDYFGVDPIAVWLTTAHDLAPLRDTVQRILDDLAPDATTC